MFHREIYAGIDDLMRLRHDSPYRLLDLGCGNARYLAPCLKRMPPALYQGVDLSGAALAEAHEYLVELAGEVVLTQGDLLEAVESTAQSWDVPFHRICASSPDARDRRRAFSRRPGAALQTRAG